MLLIPSSHVCRDIHVDVLTCQMESAICRVWLDVLVIRLTDRVIFTDVDLRPINRFNFISFHALIFKYMDHIIIIQTLVLLKP